MKLPLDQLNKATAQEFVAALGDIFEHSPWVAERVAAKRPFASARALLGPNELALYEAALASVAGLGLKGREMVAVVSLVSGYVRGAAQGALEAALAARDTGMTDDEWWEARAPLLEKYFDPERYPVSVAVQMEGVFNPTSNEVSYNLQYALDDFEFGLQRVLDGIETFIQRQQVQASNQ